MGKLLTVSHGSDLCPRGKPFKRFRFPEGFVDMSPVVHFFLVGKEVQSAFSTAIDPFSL